MTFEQLLPISTTTNVLQPERRIDMLTLEFKGLTQTGFCSMEKLRVLLLLPGQDTGPSHGYPYIFPLITIYTSEKIQCGVSYKKTT